VVRVHSASVFCCASLPIQLAWLPAVGLARSPHTWPWVAPVFPLACTPTFRLCPSYHFLPGEYIRNWRKRWFQLKSNGSFRGFKVGPPPPGEVPINFFDVAGIMITPSPLQVDLGRTARIGLCGKVLKRGGSVACSISS